MKNLIYNPCVLDLSGDYIALDLETNGLNPLTNRILAISLKTRDKHYILDTSRYNIADIIDQLDRLKYFKKVIAHNAKFDASFLYTNYHVELTNWHCTMLGNQILHNGKDDISHSLVDVLKTSLNVNHAFTDDKRLMQMSFVGRKFGEPLTKAQLDYAAEDTLYLIDLYEHQLTRARRMALERIFDLEDRLLPVIVKMEVGGCKIDSEAWFGIISKWEAQREECIKVLDAELRRLADKYPVLNTKFYTGERSKAIHTQFSLFGEPEVSTIETEDRIKYSSSAQIIKLFETLGLDVPVNKLDKESVDENSLKTYITENPESPLNDFIGLLIDFREVEKLISTYGETFLGKLDSNGFIHTQYTQCHTKTGRLASRNPNLQNIPGNELRKFFVPQTGYKLITCDMNSAEVRIAADYSQEPLLIASLLSGEDMHSKLASVSFSIIFGEPVVVSKSSAPIEIRGHKFVPEDLRQDHKTVLFAKFYKAGANRVYQVLAKYINIFYAPSERIKIAQQISEALDKEMPKLTKYLTEIIKQATKNGFLRGSKLGRIRFFDEDVYGEAANMPIQNTNAEAMKIALIKADKYFEANGWGRPVMTVHDELVCEVLAEHAEQAKVDLQKIMTDSLGWFLETVPGGSTAKIGDYWSK